MKILTNNISEAFVPGGLRFFRIPGILNNVPGCSGKLTDYLLKIIFDKNCHTK
jgi:hypothetical protein